MRNISAKIVFYGALFSLLLCCAVINVNARSEANNGEDVDQYSIKLVKILLEQPEGFSISWLEKRQNRLGDLNAIALLKLLGEQELLESPTLLRSLGIMRGAFSAPCLIEIPADRKPSVTLFVLRDLERQVRDERIRQKILETISFVQQSVSASCDEDKAEKSTGSNIESPKH
jgi:hypothetical protein